MELLPVAVRKPGYCGVCMLCESDRLELERLMARGRLPKGMLRKFGLSRWQAYKHRRHGPGHLSRPYYEREEWLRRRAQGQRLMPWWWKPGQSGNIRGRPVGIRETKPRMRPCGHAEAIRRERAERAEKWRLQQALAVHDGQD